MLIRSEYDCILQSSDKVLECKNYDEMIEVYPVFGNADELEKLVNWVKDASKKADNIYVKDVVKKHIEMHEALEANQSSLVCTVFLFSMYIPYTYINH